MFWVLIRIASRGDSNEHPQVFMKNLAKLSLNYLQILSNTHLILLDKAAELSAPLFLDYAKSRRWLELCYLGSIRIVLYM